MIFLDDSSIFQYFGRAAKKFIPIHGETVSESLLGQALRNRQGKIDGCSALSCVPLACRRAKICPSCESHPKSKKWKKMGEQTRVNSEKASSEEALELRRVLSRRAHSRHVGNLLWFSHQRKKSKRWASGVRFLQQVR